jgi:glycosyltransferase involved in cell wall biosynthesis
MSESFIPDGMETLRDVGCENWLVTHSVDNRDSYPYPPDEQIIVARPPARVRRVYDRLRGRNGADRFAWAAADDVRGLAPDLVHAHFGWAARTGVTLSGDLHTPLVVTFHGTDATTSGPRSRHGSTRGRWGYERLDDRIDLAVAVSSFIEGRLRARGYRGPTEIIPAGVRLDRFAFRDQEPPPRPLRLLFVGRLVEQKGVSVLLRALPVVAAEIADVQLDVLGDGPARHELERLARALGVGARVSFHGATRSGVLAALRRAHVLVAPSRVMPSGAAEGSPVVTKEAQAVGVPVVATHTGGMAETVPPGHRPYLVAGDDSEALAARVLGLACDPVARRSRAVEGRRWVEERFDAVVLARRTLSTYERLVGARGSDTGRAPARVA